MTTFHRGQAWHEARTLRPRRLRRAKAILRQVKPATVRHLYYRLLSEGLLPPKPAGHDNRYDRLCTEMLMAREEGQVPWSWIVDDSREAWRLDIYATAAAYAKEAAERYRRDVWATQERRVEVWSEKETVGGLLWPVCAKYRVPFQPFHGYAGGKLHEIAEGVQEDPQPSLLALYVGDFDPSGLNISDEVFPQKLEQYGAGGLITLHRIALVERDLTRVQLIEAKTTDTRWERYAAAYGRIPAVQGGRWCAELDALDPRELRRRVEAAIKREITDQDAWDDCLEGEAEERTDLQGALNAWVHLEGG